MNNFKRLHLIFLISIMFFYSNISYAVTPKINGSSGILIEKETGRILYSHNSHQKLPMASTTKVMTALVALENGNLDEKVKITNKSVGIEGSSIYLFKGEEITLKDLIYGLMLRSGNDAAVAIAYHIGGSLEGFIELMNRKAREIGANNTNFVNPHGLHDENHYTTAYDLALIAREALKNQEFKKIAKTKIWVANREINKYFYNKNKTIWQYEGGDGIKIGYTKAAGRCLVASATKNDMQLIAVVLNDGNWFNDCYNQFDFGFQTYKSKVIFDNNQFVKSIYVPNGKKNILPIVTAKKLVLPLMDEEIDKIKLDINLPKSINAPISIEQKVGAIKVFINGKLVATTDLLAKESIKEKNALEKVVDFIKGIFD